MGVLNARNPEPKGAGYEGLREAVAASRRGGTAQLVNLKVEEPLDEAISGDRSRRKARTDLKAAVESGAVS